VSITINSNLAASQSSLSLKRASDRLSKSIQRLSSGNRIVSPSEDAGGLAVAMKLESSLRRASATMMNTQNGVSFLQMQDGALKVVGEIVDRMSELKSFYNDVSKNDEDRENYNFEFKELQKELASLKSQKFNGVSLFATDSSMAGGINIMTSDDGLGDPIELSRLGLFENFKSKFGADGKLNSGSSGEYRQLIGDYVSDGGASDANPNYTSRDYNVGDVIYKASNDQDPAKSGYFMALKQVASGAFIEDTGDLTSNWIRIADKTGKGFSEAYPDAPTYDMRNLQFNAKGEAMSYLKGDIIKVQAHWNDPNSFVFLKAQNDVPQNILIDQLLLTGIGTGKYFDFIGNNQLSNGQKGKPATQFGLPNSKYTTPEGIKKNDASSLKTIMDKNVSNNYTPTFVQETDDQGNLFGNIYRPLMPDWGLKTWSKDIADYKHLDLVYDAGADGDELIFQISNKVKGNFSTGKYEAGDFVFSGESWYVAKEGGESQLINGVPRMESSSTIKNYEDGSPLSLGDEFKFNDTWFTLVAGDITTNISGDNPEQSIQDRVDSGLITNGQMVFVNNSLKKIEVTTAPDPDNLGEFINTVNQVDVSFSEIPLNSLVAVDTSEKVEFNDTLWASTSWETVADPLQYTDLSTGMRTFASDVTNDYTDLDNEAVWSKTYYGALDGVTINKDYERGDNIFYQGKHYVYVSDIDSSDESFGGEDGVNNFQQLLLGGAIQELGVYVDTVGAGGSSNKSKDSFYAANQDLEFVDRLPDTGDVRTSGVQRRGDPMQNGDGIFNSIDDQLYNSLNAGNDGIFGTMDDFYSTTPYSDVASSAAHADSDADNNRDLLNTENDLGDFSVADFVDYIQTVANFRAVNGGTMSRLNYANRILEENRINLESAHGRIMNADIALESSKLARQNVLIQASAAMITQANQMNQIVLQLLQ
jgi:flagellin-like hook-associated protein FlgL